MFSVTHVRSYCSVWLCVAGLLVYLCLPGSGVVGGENTKSTSQHGAKELLSLTDLEMAILVDAETTVFIDTDYYVSIENLNDLLSVDVTYWFDYIGEGGGTAVLDLATGFFEPARQDLTHLPQLWRGPYVSFAPERISLSGAGYDPGTLLDFWGRPYYLFSPAGLVRPPSMSITQELYGDMFDAWAIVSLGPDGMRSGDDIIREFGVPPTALVITSLSMPQATYGSRETVRGYNFGSSQGTNQVLLNGEPITTVESWESRAITFQVTEAMTSGNVVVTVDGQESNAVPLTVVEQSSNASLWVFYE